MKAIFLLCHGQNITVLHRSCLRPHPDAACPAPSRASLSTARINPRDKEVSGRPVPQAPSRNRNPWPGEVEERERVGAGGAQEQLLLEGSGETAVGMRFGWLAQR